MLAEITPVILTFNEAPNIGRALKKLSWANEILVLDSFSTDETHDIVRSFPQARIVEREFDTFAGQCNFGLEQVRTPWVLSLDADYLLTTELAAEITTLDPPEDAAGFVAEFNYCIHGYRLRNTIYPPRTILYRRQLAEYFDEGHGHRVNVRGRLISLRGKVDHDDRKPLSHWIRVQDRYLAIEARHLLNTPKHQLSRQDRWRTKVYFAPAAIFVYLLCVRGLVVDGWPGWYYVMQRTIAEMLLSLRLLTEKHELETVEDQSTIE